MSEENQLENFTFEKNPDYSLGYGDEFKKFAQTHIEELQEARDAALELSKVDLSPLQEENLPNYISERVKINIVPTFGHSRSFKVEIAGKEFFLKMVSHQSKRDKKVLRAVEEMKHTLAAREDVKKVVTEEGLTVGVQVLEPLFAYSEKEGSSEDGQTLDFFVGPWRIFKSYLSYMIDNTDTELEIPYTKLCTKLEQMGYRDIWSNVYVTPEKNFVILDVWKK